MYILYTYIYIYSYIYGVMAAKNWIPQVPVFPEMEWYSHRQTHTHTQTHTRKTRHIHRHHMQINTHLHVRTHRHEKGHYWCTFKHTPIPMTHSSRWFWHIEYEVLPIYIDAQYVRWLLHWWQESIHMWHDSTRHIQTGHQSSTLGTTTSSSSSSSSSRVFWSLSRLDAKLD